MILNKIVLRSIVVYSIVVFSCSGIHPGEVITNESIMDKSMKRLYPLIDDKVILHKYRDNFDKLIFPKHNKKLTQYCSIHRNWEDIKAIWSKNNQVDFKWQYHVSRHKKRHK